jgi:hypothetical protein
MITVEPSTLNLAMGQSGNPFSLQFDSFLGDLSTACAESR